jgi:hypothetical protein
VPESGFRRGQAEWALWRLFDAGVYARRDMPAVFRTRIKKLLDIDRSGAMPGQARGAAALAFADDAPIGSGSEAAFTAFDVFCLALALDLLDMGFKQAEIVFLLRHIREGLRPVFERIVRDYPPANRQRYRAKDFPNCPAIDTKSGAQIVDTGVYVLVRKIEIGELVPKGAKQPLIAPPQICAGQAALAAALAKLGGAQRKVLVIEIGQSARLAPALLEAAPITKRGRKS